MMDEDEDDEDDDDDDDDDEEEEEEEDINEIKAISKQEQRLKLAPLQHQGLW